MTIICTIFNYNRGFLSAVALWITVYCWTGWKPDLWSLDTIYQSRGYYMWNSSGIISWTPSTQLLSLDHNLQSPNANNYIYADDKCVTEKVNNFPSIKSGQNWNNCFVLIKGIGLLVTNTSSNCVSKLKTRSWLGWTLTLTLDDLHYGKWCSPVSFLTVQEGSQMPWIKLGLNCWGRGVRSNYTSLSPLCIN